MGVCGDGTAADVAPPGQANCFEVRPQGPPLHLGIILIDDIYLLLLQS